MLCERPSLRYSANPITSLTPIGGSSCVVRYLGRGDIAGGFFVRTIPSLNSLARISNEAGNRTLVLIGIVDNGTNPVLKAVSFCGVALPVYFTMSNSAIRGFVASAVVPMNQLGPIAFNFGNFTSNGGFACWEIFGLNKAAPIDAQSSSSAAATTRSVDLITSSGGVILGMGSNNITAAQNCTWSGDQTPVEDEELFSRESFCNTQNTNQDAANTLTATWSVISTTDATVIGASFR